LIRKIYAQTFDFNPRANAVFLLLDISIAHYQKSKRLRNSEQNQTGSHPNVFSSRPITNKRPLDKELSKKSFAALSSLIILRKFL
jgi:hypothetical protein